MCGLVVESTCTELEAWVVGAAGGVSESGRQMWRVWRVVRARQYLKTAVRQVFRLPMPRFVRNRRLMTEHHPPGGKSSHRRNPPPRRRILLKVGRKRYGLQRRRALRDFHKLPSSRVQHPPTSHNQKTERDLDGIELTKWQSQVRHQSVSIGRGCVCEEEVRVVGQGLGRETWIRRFLIKRLPAVLGLKSHPRSGSGLSLDLIYCSA